jgi:hypothetical protein
MSAVSITAVSLASFGVKDGLAENPRGKAGSAIQTSVQGLQNALATGDLAAAQNLALTIRQGSRKLQPKQSEEIVSLENTEQIEGANRADSEIALQAAARLETSGVILDVYA